MSEPHGAPPKRPTHSRSGQIGEHRQRLVVVDSLAVSTPLDPLLSLRALAAYSSLSARTLRGFTELPPDQALPAYRLPGKMLIRRSEFDTWIERYRTRGRPSLARALRDLGLCTNEPAG